MRKYVLLGILLLVLAYRVAAQEPLGPYILILGTAQDGGYPHMGCKRECCTKAWADASLKRFVVSFALVDPVTKKWWLFEATPDIKKQLRYFQVLTKERYKYLPDGIFITHAHIGHYTGLMQLGREVMGTKDIPVYVLPKMKTFLETNGPWSQLVKLNNISLQQLSVGVPVKLLSDISVEAVTVPHRDEFSETAGFKIATPAKKYLFIPDVDKWEKWDRKIVDEVAAVDMALLDATFFDETELPGKNMSEVPHPFVRETMQLFTNKSQRQKVYFIHLNHTNPLLWDSVLRTKFYRWNFNLAEQGARY